MQELESKEQIRSLSDNGPVVLYFSADWCPDCRVLDPILPEIEAGYEQFKFIYVDRDQFLDICSELDVYGIPSFLVFQEGKEIGRFVSKDRKSKEEVEAFLDQITA